MTKWLACIDESGAQEIELGTAEHLPLDQLELGNLAFGLTVRPGLDDRGGHGVLVGPNATSERGQRAGHGSIDPGCQGFALATADHRLKPQGQLACLGQ